jgi:hypothetical protein
MARLLNQSVLIADLGGREPKRLARFNKTKRGQPANKSPFPQNRNPHALATKPEGYVV